MLGFCKQQKVNNWSYSRGCDSQLMEECYDLLKVLAPDAVMCTKNRASFWSHISFNLEHTHTHKRCTIF